MGHHGRIQLVHLPAQPSGLAAPATGTFVAGLVADVGRLDQCGDRAVRLEEGFVGVAELAPALGLEGGVRAASSQLDEVVERLQRKLVIAVGPCLDAKPREQVLI